MYRLVAVRNDNSAAIVVAGLKGLRFGILLCGSLSRSSAGMGRRIGGALIEDDHDLAALGTVLLAEFHGVVDRLGLGVSAATAPRCAAIQLRKVNRERAPVCVRRGGWFVWLAS